jgi:hypothetical protein
MVYALRECQEVKKKGVCNRPLAEVQDVCHTMEWMENKVSDVLADG